MDGKDRIIPRSDCELVSSRFLNALSFRVFDAFRDPHKLARWWGPNGFTNTFHEFEFQPGGQWKYTMHGPDGRDYRNESVFMEIEEPTRIVIDHRSRPFYIAEFLLTPVANGTHIAFHHIFPSADACRRIANFVGPANDENLARLAALLEATD